MGKAIRNALAKPIVTINIANIVKKISNVILRAISITKIAKIMTDTFCPKNDS